MFNKWGMEWKIKILENEIGKGGGGVESNGPFTKKDNSTYFRWV